MSMHIMREKMIIEKTALKEDRYYSPLYYLNSARQGEELILRHFVNAGEFILLLPAYIGYSANEGSGIYDPVVKLGIKHSFYRLNKDMSINIDDLKSKLSKDSVQKIVLLVHYFGYPDNNIEDVVEVCRKHGSIIIEDAAHALFSDYIDHKCGNYGDYVLYSIHKMLPYKSGGMLKVNNLEMDFENEFLLEKDLYMEYTGIYNYDFFEIAEKRKKNAKSWEELLKNSRCDRILPIKTGCNDITPQTYPVLIKGYDRTKLYFELNEAGFGAVSLYHTMIKPIQEKFEDAVWLSKHIMNLPVHQDVRAGKIDRMFEKMMNLLK